MVLRLWTTIRDLYNPWICPLSGSDMTEAAVWIQQMAEGQKMLFPWAPGDAKPATVLFSCFVHGVGFLEATVPAPRATLGHVWTYYAANLAHTANKDYVLSVAHSALLQLPWREFTPNAADVEQMVRVIDTFLPLCHGFLGRLFVEVPWLQIVGQAPETSRTVIPAMLRLIVKLAAEPQIRQVYHSPVFRPSAKCIILAGPTPNPGRRCDRQPALVVDRGDPVRDADAVVRHVRRLQGGHRAQGATPAGRRSAKVGRKEGNRVVRNSARLTHTTSGQVTRC